MPDFQPAPYLMTRAQIFYSPDAASGGGADEGRTITVGPNDSIVSIAKENGFFWSTLWNHPKNSELKTKRKVPEVIQTGDKVYIPKMEPKKVSKPNEAKHKFMLKGEQAKFKMCFKRLGQPRANEDYIMVLNGVTTTGTTNAQGEINADVPNDATGGTITLNAGKEIFPFRIGRLDPKDSPSGVRQRLSNLGFVLDDDTNSNVMPKYALETFQEKYELSVTGEYDSASQGKMDELHPI